MKAVLRWVAMIASAVFLYSCGTKRILSVNVGVCSSGFGAARNEERICLNLRCVCGRRSPARA